MGRGTKLGLLLLFLPPIPDDDDDGDGRRRRRKKRMPRPKRKKDRGSERAFVLRSRWWWLGIVSKDREKRKIPFLPPPFKWGVMAAVDFLKERSSSPPPPYTLWKKP